MLIKRPVTIVVTILAILVLGAVSSFWIPKHLFPPIEYPSFVVSTTWPGHGARDIKESISIPLETRLSNLPGVERIESVSMNQQSQVVLFYNWGLRMDITFIELKERVEQISALLPESSAKPVVTRSTLGKKPMIRCYVQLSEHVNTDLVSLYDWVQQVLTRRLEQIEGVSRVLVHGLQEPVIDFAVDRKKLSHFDLSVSDITQPLNTIFSSEITGTVGGDEYEYPIRFKLEGETLHELEQFMVPLPDSGQGIALGELGHFKETLERPVSFGRVNGQKAVLLSIYAAEHASSFNLLKRVQSSIDDLNNIYPSYTIKILEEGVSQIWNSLSQLTLTIILSTICAFLVLVLFLQNLRRSLFIAVSIPASLALSVFVMQQAGLSLNVISLSGLLLSVGLLVDNSIIIIEAFELAVDEQGFSEKAIRSELKQVTLPVTASTFTTISIFLPIFFFTGFERELFTDLALSFSISLLASLLVAVMFLPVLIYFYSPLSSKRRGPGLLEQAIYNYYHRTLRWILRNYKWVCLLILTIIGMEILLFRSLDRSLLPYKPPEKKTAKVTLESGTPIERSSAMASSLEEYIKKELPGATIVSRGGNVDILDNSRVLEQQSHLFFTDIFHPNPSVLKTSETMVEEWQKRYNSVIVTIEEADNYIEHILYKDNYPFILNFEHPSEYDRNLHNNLVNNLKRLNYYEQLQLFTSANDRYEVHMPAAVKTKYGVNQSGLNKDLKLQTEGMFVTNTFFNGRDRKLRLIYNDRAKNIDDILVYINQQPVSMASLTEIDKVNEPALFTRLDHKAITSVAIKDGKKSTIAITDSLIALGNRMGFRSIQKEGISVTKNAILGKSLWLLAIAFVIILLILTAQYESISSAIIVAVSLPLAWVGSFVMLYIMNQSLNLFSFLGMLIVSGIAVNDSILKVSAMEFGNRYKSVYRRIFWGAKRRFRPVVMTSLTTILALLPFYFLSGNQNIYQLSTASAIIGGIVSSTILNLLIIPWLYYLKHYISDRLKYLI